ncbi:hypothetical protein PAEPH01_2868, partial [Pancytospora epiphaga]
SSLLFTYSWPCFVPMHNFLYTLSKSKTSYAAFIRNDHDKRLRQIQCMLSLKELQTIYLEKGVSEALYSDWNNFSRKNSVNWAFELFQMRRAISKGRQHFFNTSITPSFTRQANDVFILAMLTGHRQIVSFFLSSKLVHPNQSIFGSKYWPSYFLLACTCEPGVLSEFQKYWINNSIAWNGLTSSLLLGADKRPMCDNGTYIDFVSYQQFVYLNRFRGIELLTDDSSDGMKTRETWRNREEPQKQGDITGHGQGEVTGGQCKHNSVNFNLLPIFLLDFACMK